MAATVELGSIRQIWLAKLSAPTTRYSFLIADNSNTLSNAPQGRTVRLGDPVDLGPDSAWTTLSWEGGNQQDTLNDAQMYKDGNADSNTKHGKLRLHNAFSRPGWVQNKGIHSFTLCTGGNEAFMGRPFLYAGEAYGVAPTTGANPASASTFTLWKRDASAGTFTAIKSDFTKPLQAIHSTMGDTAGAGWILIGLGGTGGPYIYNPSIVGAVPIADAGWPPTWPSGAVTVLGFIKDGIVNYGDSAYALYDNMLLKRTQTGAFSAQWSVVKWLRNYDQLSAIAVWNNRIWFSSVTAAAHHTSVFVSDGITVTQAFEVPEDFFCYSMVSHYGALYMAGWRKRSESSTGLMGVVWKYDGSSLSKLYEEGYDDPNTSNSHFIGTLATYGRFLVWGKPATPDDHLAGLTYYDAETDAILTGPTVEVENISGHYYILSMAPWAGTLAISGYDDHDYGGTANHPSHILQLEPTLYRHNLGTRDSSHSIDVQPATRSQFILSSSYDGTVPAEQKVWLTGRLRCKIPQYTQIVVKALLDGSSTEITVATIPYNAGKPDWYDAVFAMKDPGSGLYLRSTLIQYKLYLQNVNALGTTVTPEVDALSINFTPAPSKRRQWGFRAICEDAQLRLDGSNNPLNTADLQTAKLEELWSSRDPVLFWPPDTATAQPTDSSKAVEVLLQSFNENSYRVDSKSLEEMAEVAMTAVEVVTT